MNKWIACKITGLEHNTAVTEKKRISTDRPREQIEGGSLCLTGALKKEETKEEGGWRKCEERPCHCHIIVSAITL